MKIPHHLTRSLLALILGASVCTTSLRAQNPPAATSDSTALAGQLVDLMHVEKTLDSMKAKMMGMMTPQKPSGISQDAWDQVTKRTQSSMSTIFSALSMEKMKPLYVSVYAETFSPEELQGLIDFYKSPTGQKFLEKQPQLQAAIMEKSQAMMKDLMPQIMGSLHAPAATGSSTPIQPVSASTPAN